MGKQRSVWQKLQEDVLSLCRPWAFHLLIPPPPRGPGDGHWSHPCFGCTCQDGPVALSCPPALVTLTWAPRGLALGCSWSEGPSAWCPEYTQGLLGQGEPQIPRRRLHLWYYTAVGSPGRSSRSEFSASLPAEPKSLLVMVAEVTGRFVCFQVTHSRLLWEQRAWYLQHSQPANDVATGRCLLLSGAARMSRDAGPLGTEPSHGGC